MPGLIRSGSFGRRAKSNPTGQPASDASKPATLNQSTSVVGKLMRSASFGRKRQASSQRERAEEEEPTDADESSESRSQTPETEHHVSVTGMPDDDAMEVKPLMQDRLYGWLRKKHHKAGNHWARRYFFVDERRGTLSYSKAVSGRGAKPSAVLPLADITRLEALDEDPCAFVIRCPPIHLTVAAVSTKERKNWMAQLELRIDIWRLKQAEKV